MKRLEKYLLLTALSASASFAQTTFATITGTVTDPNGLAVPGAEIEAISSETNYRYPVKSNGAGVYTVSQVNEGTYTLHARAGGFKEFVANDIKLAARDIRRLDIKLELGSVDTAIEVQAGTSLIETETARLSDTKTGELMNRLPFERDPAHFLNMAPSVYTLPGTTGTSITRYAGSRTNQENESVDGVTIADNNGSTYIGPFVNFMEWIQEMRIDMSNNSAEFGAMGQMTLISKSGSNKWHGSIFDYYASGGTAARNPFSLTVPSYVQHRPGGSLGGPIILPKLYNGRNKTFFFFSFEDTRGGQVQQLINPTVPLASWRAGDFSALLPGTVVRDPFNGNAPFPGNIIPANRLNSVALAMQNLLWPLPNRGSSTVLQNQNYQVTLTRPFDPTTFTQARIDHRFSEKFTIFARYNFTHYFNRPYDSNLPNTIGQSYNRRQNDAANMSATYIFRPNLVNEFRWGLAYNDNNLWPAPNGASFAQSLGLQGLAPGIPSFVNGVPAIAFSNLGLTGVSVTSAYRAPGYRNRNQEYQDHVNWFHGRHSLNMGIDLTRVRFAALSEPTDLFGSFTFSNTFTGFTYADFLLGIPATVSRSYPALETNRVRWAYDSYIADDFKVNSKLTLNLGLRYEFHPPYRQDGDLMAVFDIKTGSIVVPDAALSQVSPLVPVNYVKVIGAKQAGLPQRLINSDKNNFAPRIGVAYRPWGLNTVVRAGFGIFYDVAPYAVSSAGNPFLIQQPAFTNPANAPAVILPQIYPSNASGPATLSIPTAVNPNLVIPYSMQYNITVEHQQWGHGFRASFIADNTRKGEYSYNINQPLPNTIPYIQKPRLFPNYPAFNYYTNGAGHQYNSGEFEVKRAMGRGLTYDFSYTLARDIEDLERGQSPENAYDRKREIAVWRDIPTHRITSNFVYELPFGKGKPFLSGTGRITNLLVGGWYVTGMYILHSGNFLTPLWTGPDPTNTANTSSLTPAQVTLRPDCIADPNLPSDQRSVTRWFNGAAFKAPSGGNFGSCAKGVIKGPGDSIVNAGTGKDVLLGEHARLRLELRAENVLNHPNWSEPGLNMTVPSQFGIISGIGGVNSYDSPGMRFLRYGARIEW